MGEPTLLPEVKPSYGDLANFIGGEWRTPRATEWLEDANPANGRVIARVPLSTKEDVDEAVQAALAAWDEWRETPPLSRARYLFALRDLLEERFEDLARVLVQHNGKTIDDEVLYQPLGVFAGISPFNFPAMVQFWFWPYAVATGNTWIAKPSEQDPIVQSMIFHLIQH